MYQIIISERLAYVRECPLFFFEDINEDNKDEIVIGILYVSGAGPQGMIPYTEIRIYEDGGNEFVYNENLSDEINAKLTDEVTAEYVKTLLKD